MTPMSPLETIATLRRLLLGVLLLGSAGTATELLLIGHDEDRWQLIPLAALAAVVLASLAMLATGPGRAPAATRLFRLAMLLLMLVGGLGSLLHYRASMAFKREMDPSLGGFALFSSVIQAKAPPTLAPGTLALLGLLGLACTFRLEHQVPSRKS